MRDFHHTKVCRLLGSLVDTDYLSGWVFPGLEAEFGQGYNLQINLDHYGPYTSPALLRLYPIFSLEKSISITPDYDPVPKNLIYNVYDVISPSKLDLKPRVYVYRNISAELLELPYQALVEKLGEWVLEADGMSKRSPDEQGMALLRIIQQINRVAPVERVTVQWYDHPTSEALEAAAAAALAAEIAANPRRANSKRQRPPPAFDLGTPSLKTELNLPELSNKFYHVLNPTVVLPQK